MHGELIVVYRGRKRKANVVRDAKGKSRGERPREVISETLGYRRRDLEMDGIKLPPRPDDPNQKDPAEDPLTGFSLGRLLLRHRASPYDPASITQAQHDAGEAWAKIVRKHALIMGYSLSRPSPSFSMVGGGRDCEPEPEKAHIERTRRKFTECYEALLKAGRACNAGIKVALICYDVCIDNRKLGTLSGPDYGNLRVGLNALVRVLGEET